MSFQIDANVDYYNNSTGGSIRPTEGKSTAGETHEYAIQGNQITIDGTTTTGPSAAVDKPAAGPLLFLATNFGKGLGNVYTPPRKVYYIDVTTDGETILRLRPAKDANGKATLYDEVAGEYLTVENGGVFSVGNDTEPEEPTIDEDPDLEPETTYDAAHTIVCYGDSLTEGDYAAQITFGGCENFFEGRLEGVTAEAGYPWWLANRIPTEYNVIAQARSGMCVDYMLGWQGGLKVRLSGDVTLPAEADTPVAMPSALIFDGAYKYAPNGWKWELSHTDPAKGDKWLGCGTPILPSTDTKDKCVCDSITGVLTGWICGKRVRLQSSHNGDMTISRVVAGEEPLTLPAGATFTPDTAKLWPGHIQVIFGGANDGAGQVDQYIADIKTAVTGVEKYVVVSPHCSWKAEYAAKFEAAFGDHYLNLHDAMSTRGLAKAKAIGDPAATTDWRAADGSGLLAGSVDSYTHFNTRGYKVLAAFVEEKLVELGYISGGHQHSWSAWGNDTATDWEDGTQTRTCTDPECGKTEERFSPQKWKALKVDAGGYYDTGLHPNLAKLYVAFDIEFDASRLNAGKLQGLMVASGGNALNLNLEKMGSQRGLSTDWDFDYYNNPAESGAVSTERLYPEFGKTDGRHLIEVKGMSISIDGVEVADRSQDAVRDVLSTDTLKLLSTYSTTYQQTKFGTAGNIYSIKIGEIEGDAVKIAHSYRPAKDGNQATLWDEVTGTYLNPPKQVEAEYGAKPFQFSLVSARAAGARTWTGAADDNKWETNENWDPMGAPEATEDVTLDSSVGNITALPSALLPKGKRTITLKTDGEHSITIKTDKFNFEDSGYANLTLAVNTKPGANSWVDLGANGFNMTYGVVHANLDGNRLKFNVFKDNTAGSEFVIDNGASFVAGYQAELGIQATKMTLKGDSFMNCGNQITLKNKFQLTLVPTPDLEQTGAYLRGAKYVINSGLNVTVDVSAFAKQHVTRTYTFMSTSNASTINLPTATVVGEGAKNCTVTFEKSSDNKTILMTVKSAPKGLILLLR